MIVRLPALCGFIKTREKLWSACAIYNDDGRFFAIAESEGESVVVIEALSEQTALYRLAAKLNGNLYFV